MGGGRRRVKSPNQKIKDRDEETIHLVNAAIDNGQVAELRRLASVRGLVNHQLRSRAWPILAGLDPQSEEEEEEEYLESSSTPHRDSSTVRVDVERSLWTFASDEERPARRLQLERLLNATVNLHQGDVFYYQGLHDVASVLLLVLGEAAAAPLLRRLATLHLRDYTRSTLDPALELLALLPPLLAQLDPPLAAHLQDLGVPSFFALSWLLTWFSHTVPSLHDAARLFDLFLAAHPLMPLYLGVAAMHSQRAALLACPDMPEAHSTLHNLSLTRAASIDQLTAKAIQLMKWAPPDTLSRRIGVQLEVSVTADAQLLDGAWWVPARPVRRKQYASGTLATAQHAVRQLVLRTASSSGGRAVLTTALSLTSVVGLWLVVARMQQQGGLGLGHEMAWVERWLFSGL